MVVPDTATTSPDDVNSGVKLPSAMMVGLPTAHRAPVTGWGRRLVTFVSVAGWSVGMCVCVFMVWWCFGAKLIWGCGG